MIGKTNAASGGKGDILGEKLNLTLRTNQAGHSDLNGVKIVLRYADVEKEYTWNGKEITMLIPPYVEYSVTFGDVTDYKTPEVLNYTAQEDNSRSAVVEYLTTVVTASVKSNQPTTEDLADATLTIGGKTLKNGESAKFASGTKVTPTWSNVADYKTPTASEITLEGASVTIEGTYETEVVSVSVSADNGGSMNVSVTIDGELFAYSGTAITKKVAFEKTYSVSVSDVEGFVAPASQTFVADSLSRSVSMVYVSSKLKVNILSNQENDAVIGAVKAVVSWDGASVEVANGESVSAPTNKEITITFPSVDGYKTPAAITFTHIGGIVEKSGTYYTEKLVVNVGADDGSVSGYEITISEHETVGVNTKYAKLDYIESDGNQYITTNIIANQDMRVAMDVQIMDDITEYAMLFGVKKSYYGEDTYYYQVSKSSDMKIVYRYGTHTDLKIELSEEELKGRLIIDANKNILSVNGNSIEYSKEDFNTTYPLILFTSGDNNIVGFTAKSKAKLYSCQIYDNDILVRDYIPALREDGIAGLYDAVSDAFYPSEGSSNFLYGETKKKTIAVQTSATGTYKIAHGTDYEVSASDVSGFIAPTTQRFISSETSRVVSMRYEAIKDETLIVNVSASDGASVDGQVVTVKQSVANGVYIEDIEGNLWTEDAWDGSVTPNGIAVVTNECQFVMALELLPANYKWGGRGTAVSGIATTTAKATAVTDYNGKTNTETIINALKGVTDDYNSTGAPAAEACVSYVFPNGKNGYLGSMGEWKAIIDNTGLINTALSKVIGKNGLWDGGSWTSTQYNGNNAWLVSVGTELTYAANYKSGSMNVRPLTTLGNSKPITNGKATFQIPNGTTYEVSVSDKDGYATPASQTFTAIGGTRTISMQYTIIPYINLAGVDIYGNKINFTTANCYVVKKAGVYRVPLVYGNGFKDGFENPSAYTKNSGSYSHDFVNHAGTVIASPYIESYVDVTSAQLSISDTDGVFSEIEIPKVDTVLRYVQFRVNDIPSTGANGIISVKDSSGTIVWSWHIWVWPHDLTPVEITNSTGVKYKILPVNLATKLDSADSINKTTGWKNWFYQFGRPTPLLCPQSYNSTSDSAKIGIDTTASSIQQGIRNPTTFYMYSNTYYYNWFKSNSNKTYNLWDAACTTTGNSDNNVVKTIYDPCPVGFKIPNGNTFTYFSKTNVVGSFANGWKFKRYSGDTTGVFFPASGSRSRSNGSLGSVGSLGYVWLSSANSQNDAYGLTFFSSSVFPQDYDYRASGFSVRPVQE